MLTPLIPAYWPADTRDATNCWFGKATDCRSAPRHSCNGSVPRHKGAHRGSPLVPYSHWLRVPPGRNSHTSQQCCGGCSTAPARIASQWLPFSASPSRVNSSKPPSMMATVDRLDPFHDTFAAHQCHGDHDNKAVNTRLSIRLIVGLCHAMSAVDSGSYHTPPIRASWPGFAPAQSQPARVSVPKSATS